MQNAIEHQTFLFFKRYTQETDRSVVVWCVRWFVGLQSCDDFAILHSFGILKCSEDFMCFGFPIVYEASGNFIGCWCAVRMVGPLRFSNEFFERNTCFPAVVFHVNSYRNFFLSPSFVYVGKCSQLVRWRCIVYHVVLAASSFSTSPVHVWSHPGM